LKIIRPEAIRDPEEARAIERRFKQELLLARQVSHKNVVRIHDLGEIDGIKYITMSYIDGDDLSSVLKRVGKLPIALALRIMRQIVAGLAAAHEAGVVHRDLKPANIMIEGERAVIMDFGIARSSSARSEQTDRTQLSGSYQAGRDTQQSITSGMIVGTIAYMAPEQAKGDSVDQRADIYAFGLIASDMLLGPNRRRQQTLEDLRRDSDEPPTPLRLIEPDVPETLEAVVLRCLQRHPARRYQTAAELLTALDRLDSKGNMLPVIRRLTRRMVAATLALGVALLAATFYITRMVTAPPVEHDPISVVIADVQNRTADPVFDRALESTLRLSLEGARFISAYDRTIINRIGVQAPDKLDEQAAQEIAVKQGVGVVLAGSLSPRGDGYTISLRATQPVTGELITTAEGTAADRNQVLTVVAGLGARVREALGDDTSDSTQRFAMETLTATSLEAVREYALGQEAMSNNRNEEARQRFQKAVARDPKFGAAYAGLAIASRNIGQQQEAEQYANEAVRYLDSMTERERYRVRGLLYYLTSDYEACVKEYGDLLERYAGDVAARNNLALCLTYLRDLPGAREQMQQVVKILPQRALYRLNLALYAAYSSDFATAETEARMAEELGSPLGPLAMGFAQLGRGQLAPATASYQRLAKLEGLGLSRAVSALGDLAVYEGRFSEGVRILQQGAAADLKDMNSDRAAAKFVAIAHAELLRGRMAAANAAAENALRYSQALKIRFLAARVFAAAGQSTQARSLAATLAAELPAEPQALAKVIEGNVALSSGDARLAIRLLTEANSILETWIGRFDLGRANLEAGLLLQADSEFDRCLRRQGEALSLFLDEEPTYAYFPLVAYYTGRAREGLKSDRFVDSYRAYLAIREKAGEDPLLPEVRRRAALGK
jgi:tetratricopeptide (TPR) repeat protein/tRNA A-37 threonylcarbamoyl transferase component Bud32